MIKGNYVKLTSYWVEFNFDLGDGVEDKVIISLESVRVMTDNRPRLFGWLCVNGFVVEYPYYKYADNQVGFDRPRTWIMGLNQ